MNWLIVFKNNFKRRLNKKSYFFIMLLLPILIVLLGAVANLADNPSMNIGIINSSQSRTAENVMQALNNT